MWSFCFVLFSLKFAFSLPVNLFLRVRDGMTRETQMLTPSPHCVPSVPRSILGAVMLLALRFQCGGCNNGESYFINMVWRDRKKDLKILQKGG